MIQFFRKIRQQLIGEGRIRKYLIYAFGEILLVMIGILLALQVNNLNENRKTRIEEKKALAQIRLNLVKEIEGFDDWVTKFSGPNIEYLSKISDGKMSEVPLERFVRNINNYYEYNSVNTAYVGLKTGGKLTIIQNELLKEKIIEYYEYRGTLLKSWAEWQKNFVVRNIESYIVTELPIDKKMLLTETTVIKKQLESGNLISLVNFQLSALRSIDWMVEGNKERANEIIDLIEKEATQKGD